MNILQVKKYTPFYKHKPYKHTQPEKPLKIKHMLSIIHPNQRFNSRMNKIQLTKVFLWKYTTYFKHLHKFLASELVKNLLPAIFVFMLIKSRALLHEAVRGPSSVCKHILSIFWGWKRPFANHTEVEEKTHHACKENSVPPYYQKRAIEQARFTYFPLGKA